METLKIQLNKPEVIFLKIVTFSCFALLFWWIYFVFSNEYLSDVERFDSMNLMFMFIFFMTPCLQFLEEIIYIQKLQNTWRTDNKYEIEIPYSTITGWKLGFRKLNLQTEEHHFEISSFYISNFGKLEKSFLQPISYDNRKKYKSKLAWFQFGVTLSLLLLFGSWMNGMAGGKYDLKYYLPFVKKIETVEIKGNLKESIKLSYFEKTDTYIGTSLFFENSKLRFEYPGGHELNDEIFNVFGVKTLPIGTEMTLKIRKSEKGRFERQLKSGKGEIRFYELKVGEDVLLRKRGLK